MLQSSPRYWKIALYFLSNATHTTKRRSKNRVAPSLMRKSWFSAYVCVSVCRHAGLPVHLDPLEVLGGSRSSVKVHGHKTKQQQKQRLAQEDIHCWRPLMNATKQRRGCVLNKQRASWKNVVLKWSVWHRVRAFCIVSQKTSHFWLAITLTHVNGFWHFSQTYYW